MSVDDEFVATGSRDTTARLYSRSTGECLKTFGKPVPRGGLEHIKGRDLPPVLGNSKPEEGGHSGDVNAVCLSTKGGVLYTGADGLGTTDFLKAWDTKTGILLGDMLGHREGVYALAKCEDRGLLFSGSCDRAVRVWDMTTRECLHVLEEHTDKVRCLHWDEEHQVLISGGHDNQVLVWSPETWSVQQRLDGHKDWVTCITSCPDRIVTTSVDKTCRVWDRSGKLLHTLMHDTWVVGCGFYQDLLITALGDASLAAFDSMSWQQQWKLPNAHTEHNAVSGVVQAGELLLSSSWDGTVKEWTREQLEEDGEAGAPAEGVKVLEVIEDTEEPDALDGDIFGEDDLQ